MVHLMHVIVSHDRQFFIGYLASLITAGDTGKDGTETTTANSALGFIRSINPREQTEACLAAQIAATQNAVMTFARRLNHAGNLAEQDSAVNTLTRSHCAQMGALKKYRGTVEQEVTVNDVSVQDNAQAIIGFDLWRWGRKKRDQPCEPAPALLNAPLCHDRSKRTGKPCQNPAKARWKVCHHHGAGGGAPCGEKNGDYQHGYFTKEAIALTMDTAALLRRSRHLIESIEP